MNFFNFMYKRRIAYRSIKILYFEIIINLSYIKLYLYIVKIHLLSKDYLTDNFN
jgi:hypothetical protein